MDFVPYQRDLKTGRERRLFTHSQLMMLALGNFPQPRFGETGDVLASKNAYHLASGVLVTMFGADWFGRYFGNEARAVPFLHNKADSWDSINTHMIRVTALGQMAFNLQRVAGVDDVYDQLRDGMIESAFAELDVGMMLLQYGIGFRYVETRGERGKDYEAEVFHPNGALCCLETKCRLEGQEFDGEKIMATLNEARGRNLPKDRPGIIALKIPPDWIKRPALVDEMDRLAKRFFGSTERITSLIMFANHLNFEKGKIATVQASNEYVNEKHRFLDLASDWRLRRFAEPIPPAVSSVDFITLLTGIGRGRAK